MITEIRGDSRRHAVRQFAMKGLPGQADSARLSRLKIQPVRYLQASRNNSGFYSPALERVGPCELKTIFRSRLSFRSFQFREENRLARSGIDSRTSC